MIALDSIVKEINSIAQEKEHTIEQQCSPNDGYGISGS
jgi:hypothetical protein